VNAAATISLAGALAAGAACAASILATRRRAVILALLVQFAGTAVLLSAIPLALAVAYAAVGLSVAAILAVTPAPEAGIEAATPSGVPSGLVFRTVSVLLVSLAAGALGLQVLSGTPGITPGQAIGAGLLFGLGLLHVGLSEEPLHVGAGLVAVLGGFEIGYASVEPSVALHALLIAMPVLIAVVVAYLSLLTAAAPERRP
jgi:hypothetical protein